MLYQVGGLQFRTHGLNPHEVKREVAADYAEKDVVGGLKPAEFMGPGDDVLELTCKLFTRHQPGGLAAIGALDQMRLSGTPQICVRGDGANMGWRRVTKARERARYLDIGGVGKVIEYDLTLKLTPRPSAAGMLTVLYTIAVDGLASLFSDLISGR